LNANPARRTPPGMAALRSLGRIGVATLVAIPLLLYPYLYLAQERMLFLRPPMDPQRLNWARAQFGPAEVSIPAADGTPLHGWLVAAADPGPAPLLIYFGGNAEEVSGLLAERPRLPGWAMLLVNYRGYGLSAGTPSQEKLFGDALNLYDWALRRPEVDPTRIVAWGRSLGTGVAVHLAAERPLAGVLLISPYDSMTAVAQGHYPYVPVSWLLRHPFDSQARAGAIEAPLLALAARADEVVPVARTQALVEAWGGPKQLVVFRNGDHNDLEAGNDYWGRIHAFLATIAPPPTPPGGPP
jgi:uncharacterized protein